MSTSGKITALGSGQCGDRRGLGPSIGATNRIGNAQASSAVCEAHSGPSRAIEPERASRIYTRHRTREVLPGHAGSPTG